LSEWWRLHGAGRARSTEGAKRRGSIQVESRLSVEGAWGERLFDRGHYHRQERELCAALVPQVCGHSATIAIGFITDKPLGQVHGFSITMLNL
jgi:hypothetical protein